jgi:hypothetical protein
MVNMEPQRIVARQIYRLRQQIPLENPGTVLRGLTITGVKNQKFIEKFVSKKIFGRWWRMAGPVLAEIQPAHSNRGSRQQARAMGGRLFCRNEAHLWEPGQQVRPQRLEHHL